MTNTHIVYSHIHSTERLRGFELHLDKRLSHKFFIPRLTPHFALNIHLLTYRGTRTEIPFCQLSAPDHVTIKDAALQLNTASKSQGKESWEKHLFLSSMRDHTGGEGVETDRVRQREGEEERASLCTVYWHCVWWRDESLLFRDWFPATDCVTTPWRTDCQDLPVLFWGLQENVCGQVSLALSHKARRARDQQTNTSPSNKPSNIKKWGILGQSQYVYF